MERSRDGGEEYREGATKGGNEVWISEKEK